MGTIEEDQALGRSYLNHDFINLHLEACGKTNIPETLLEWAALGTLSGLIQDRVEVKLYQDAESMNLAQLIVLIASSGAGKGRAIEKMLTLVSDTFIDAYLPDGSIQWRGTTPELRAVFGRAYEGLHIYSGTLTRAGAQDLLTEQTDPQTGCKGHAKLWWVAEELSHCFGAMSHATETIKQLVAWKEKSVMAHQMKTRKDNRHLYIKDPCVNMLAASTWDWMGQVMTKQDAQGGMLRRTRFVEASYDIRTKTLDEQQHPDAAAMKAALRLRIFGYAQTHDYQQCVAWGPGSREAFQAWFDKGLPEVPTDPAQHTLHSNREAEVAKLAALSAVSRWNTQDHKIAPAMIPWDIARAVRWWDLAYETAPKLWLHTQGSEQAQKMQILVNVIEALAKSCKNVVPEMLLAKTLASQNFVKRDLDEGLMTLMQRGTVRRDFKDGKWMVVWQGR